MTFNKNKFKNLVHYICYRAEPQKLGSTKLNKILWYSDVITYLFTQKPLTGEVYKKQQFGPVPRDILSVIDELRTEGVLVVRENAYYGHIKKEYIALNFPDLSIFTANEISLIDSILNGICEEYTAKSISDKTHDIIWELAEIGEEIPYYAILSSNLGEITEKDIVWASKILKKAA